MRQYGHYHCTTVGRVRLMHLHEIDVDEEWLAGILGCFLDITVKKWNTDHSFFRSVDVLTVYLEIFMGFFASFA